MKRIKITLPKNCEAENITTSVEDGCLIVMYDPKDKSFKNGDIISNRMQIIIYRDINELGNILSDCSLFDGELFISNADLFESYFSDRFIKASHSEKKLLIDALANKNKMIEPFSKEIIRWRADDNCNYYYIDSNGTIQDTLEGGDEIDFRLYEIGNYFRTEELAKEKLEKIKEILND
jgi:hypothetical protein